MLGANFIMMVSRFGYIRDLPTKRFPNETNPDSKGKTPYLYRYARWCTGKIFNARNPVRISACTSVLFSNCVYLQLSSLG